MRLWLRLWRDSIPGDSVAYGFHTPNLCCVHSRHVHACPAERGNGRAYPVGQGSLDRRSSSARPRACRGAHGAINEPDSLLAPDGSFVVGVVLSVEVFCRLGIGFLLFGNKLFDRRPRGPCPSPDVANA